MKASKLFFAATLAGLVAGLPAPFAWAQGPGSQSSETVARPKKKDAPAAAESTEQPKIPSKFTRKDKDAPEGLPTFRSDVNTVQLDVAVMDNKGHFIPNIPRGNFRVLEDNVPQQISNFGTNADAPMTVALVIEFSNLYQQYWSEGWYETLTAAYGFIETLKPDDYVAVVAYDLKTEILSDFTTDREKTGEAMQRLRIAGFSEANMYDALVDTAQRMSTIDGRKAIILISTGRDTFSKLTFDKARKGIQEAAVPIYAISLLQALRLVAEPYMGDIQRLDFLQADNQMNTFARESGGQAFFPRFVAEYPGIYAAVADSLRNQYSLAYQPSNQAKDGKYRNIKVELVDPANGNPLRVVDQKGKPIKYSIVAKRGYNAPRDVE
ncbi:MAG: VWA domain-containing protein [Acidobacteriia bacterium]|nr:VWA domain-containing protein [Terriglobia bacterium]